MDIFDPLAPHLPRLNMIPVRQGIYDSDDPHALIGALMKIMEYLADYGAYTRHEIPAALLYNHRLSNYQAEVSNGGHEQFVANSGWSEDVQREVEEGLGAVGAYAHQRLFREVAQYTNASAERTAAVRARGGFNHPIHGKVDEWIEQKDREFHMLNATNDVTTLQKRWLKSLSYIKPVPDLQWKFSMAEIFGRNPLLDARLAALGKQKRDFVTDLIANAPLKKSRWEYAAGLARQHGPDLPFMAKNNWTEEHKGKEVWLSHFEISGVNYLAIYYTDEVVFCNMRETPDGLVIDKVIDRTDLEYTEV